MDVNGLMQVGVDEKTLQLWESYDPAADVLQHPHGWHGSLPGISNMSLTLNGAANRRTLA